jgi:hypothetical protein
MAIGMITSQLRRNSMLCYACKSDFKSYKWLYQDIKVPICDVCLVAIIQIKLQIAHNEVQRLEAKLEKLKKEIANECGRDNKE